MIAIPNVENWFKKLKPNGLDDSIDRLSYFYTTCILLVFTCLTMGKLYLVTSLQCWSPAEWKDPWRDYARDHCFAKNTYVVSPNQDIPEDIAMREGAQINYYQWVPVILAIQALLFYLPSSLWALLVETSDIDAFNLVGHSVDAATKDLSERRKAVKEIAAQMAESVAVQSTVGVKFCRLSCCVHLGRKLGCTLTLLYVLIKAVYAANALAHLYFINSFLGDGSEWWGIKMLHAVVNESFEYRSKYFPVITFCDVVIRELGDNQRHTIQCVLAANIFIEKIFIFLWVWLALVPLLDSGLGVSLVAVAAVASALYAMVELLCKNRRVKVVALGLGFSFIRRSMRLALALGSQPDSMSATQLDAFVSEQLRPDGVLVLKFVADHAGDAVCSEMVSALYELFEQRRPAMLLNGTNAMPDRPAPQQSNAEGHKTYTYEVSCSGDGTSTNSATLLELIGADGRTVGTAPGFGYGQKYGTKKNRDRGDVGYYPELSRL